ncbi:hypothetical protein OAU72_05820, partial [Hyphomicrobiales bacterium]|nr:hypothetical protein [Hyphomicrobiales bacterium]
MPQLDFLTFPSQIIWLFITFTALYIVMAKIALPKLANAIELRRDIIARDLEEAEHFKDEVIPCPNAMILADAVSLNEFSSYASPDESDLIHKARIETITYECSYEDLQVKGNLYISGSVALGQKGASGSKNLPIFVALVKNNTDVTNRKFINIKADMPEGGTLLRFDHVVKDFEFYVDSVED